MTVLRHVIDSISPASAAHAEGARQRVAAAGAPLLEKLAMRLAGAQHTARVRAAQRTIVVVAGDHGAGDPGVSLGAAHPTAVAARALADGTSALAQVARASGTPFVLVDAGAAEAMPDSAVALGRGPTRNLLVEPAMTVIDAALGLEQGIALAVSLGEQDAIAVGALGIGAEVAAAALLGAAVGTAAVEAASLLGGDDARHDAMGIASDDAGVALAWHAGAALYGAAPLEQLAHLGGAETAVLAGVMLGAASTNTPILLDGEATGAAALVAAAFAPAVVGYLVATHAGSRAHRRILDHLGLAPVFEVGLGHGDGTGAAMVLPLIDQVAALANSD